MRAAAGRPGQPHARAAGGRCSLLAAGSGHSLLRGEDGQGCVRHCSHNNRVVAGKRGGGRVVDRRGSWHNRDPSMYRGWGGQGRDVPLLLLSACLRMQTRRSGAEHGAAAAAEEESRGCGRSAREQVSQAARLTPRSRILCGGAMPFALYACECACVSRRSLAFAPEPFAPSERSRAPVAQWCARSSADGGGVPASRVRRRNAGRGGVATHGCAGARDRGGKHHTCSGAPLAGGSMMHTDGPALATRHTPSSSKNRRANRGTNRRR